MPVRVNVTCLSNAVPARLSQGPGHLEKIFPVGTQVDTLQVFQGSF